MADLSSYKAFPEPMQIDRHLVSCLSSSLSSIYPLKDPIMELDVRTALILLHPNQEQVLLLRRSETKRLFPNLITGVGGKVELESGEGSDLMAAMWREFCEETAILPSGITDVRLRLSTLISRPPLQVVLLWYTGQLVTAPTDLSCTEGKLKFHPIDQLPFKEMIPTAREAIPFILSLHQDDERVYNGCFDTNMKLITNHDKGNS